MILIDGDAKQAEYIEEKIKAGTYYLKVPFFVYKKPRPEPAYDFEKGLESRCFTREYEVLGSRDALEKAKKVGDIRGLETLVWLMGDTIKITFRYDYRDNKCTIYVNSGSWQRLLKMFPEFQQMVKYIEPNRCEIVSQTVA